MNAKDQLKCLKAGFTIIRTDDHTDDNGLRINIKAKTKKQTSWHNLYKENFPSKAARDREVAKLLKDPMIIQD